MIRDELVARAELEPDFELVLEQYDLGHAMYPDPFTPRRPARRT